MAKLHYSMVGAIVTVTLFNGERFSDEAKEILEEVEFDASACPEALMDGDVAKSLAGYGLQKLLQDRTSQDTDVKEKLANMKAYFDELFTQGKWKKVSERTSTGATGSRRKITATLAEAIARIQGITAVQAEAALKALDKDRFEAVTSNPKVLDMIAIVEKEAGETVDLSEL